MAGNNAEQPVATVIHIRLPDHDTTSEADLRAVLHLLNDLTPVVETVPPGAALADLSGSLRYHGRHPAELAQILRARALALMGLPLRVGVARNRSLAAMASAHADPRTGIRYVGPADQDVIAFAHPLPVEALHGVGRIQAAKLTSYGIRTIGLLAAVPPATVQRVLGGRLGGELHRRARGIDPRPIIPTGLPYSVSAVHTFDRDMLDPAITHAALVRLAADIGSTLRRRKQAARALTLTIAFADRSRLIRSRTLAQATNHTEDLRTTACVTFEALALQRARIRSLSLRAEQLIPAEQAPTQLTLDSARENHLRAESAVDAINRRFGTGTAGPAAAFNRAC